MVHSITPPDESSSLDSILKAKRFSYQIQNQYKKDPWSNFGNGKASKNKNEPVKNFSTVKPSDNNGFSLDNVWSIRNVPVKQTNFTKPENSLIYSRHKKSKQGKSDRNTPNNKYAGQNLTNKGTDWNPNGQKFLFGTDSLKTNNIPQNTHVEENDDEDFSYSDNEENDIIDHRLPSARTQRAQRFQAAYMKSRGIGDYTIPTKTYQKKDDEFGWY